jgi:hypothetical protein
VAASQNAACEAFEAADGLDLTCPPAPAVP